MMLEEYNLIYFFALNNTSVDTTQNQQALYSFNGYVLIGDEVIEYDGVEYQYTPIDSNTPVPVIIKSQTDIYKYRALSKSGYSNINDPNSAYFKPTGRYKIKSRKALSTDSSSHPKSPASFFNATNGSGDGFNRYSINLVTSDLANEKPGSGNYKPPSNRSSSSVQKSFLTLSNLDKNKTTYDIAIKSFDSIDTTKSYFAFGTRMFFDSQFESPEQIGGISFFLNEDGKSCQEVICSICLERSFLKTFLIKFFI